jgi:predicted GNAT family N-acyltransferase
MIDQKPFKPQHLIGYLKRTTQAAGAFSRSFELLRADESKRDAALVCLAVTLELQLKSRRCAVDGEHPQNREIGRLFASLPAADQASIRNLTIASWLRDKTASAAASTQEFDAALLNLDQNFVHWQHAQDSLDSGRPMYMPDDFALHLLKAIEATPIMVKRAPKDHTDRDIDLFIAQVLAGGRIAQLEPARVRSCSHLVYLFHGARLAGVSAIKAPDMSYRTSIFFKAGTLLEPSLFNYEFGYVSIDSGALGQGHGTAVSEHALASLGDDPIYATVHEDNAVMQHILEKQGFVREGEPYKNAKNNVLRLFVKNI